MKYKRIISSDKRTIARAKSAVKARIIAAGLSMGDVAKKAGIQRSTFSDYLSGRITSAQGQLSISIAFNTLTGQGLGAVEFWGPLASAELTGREVA